MAGGKKTPKKTQKNKSSKTLFPDDESQEIVTCRLCAETNKDSDRGMICCDECEYWFHYDCVEVDQATIDEDKPWSCTECLKKSEEARGGVTLQMISEMCDQMKQMKAEMDKLKTENEALKAEYLKSVKAKEVTTNQFVPARPVVDVETAQKMSQLSDILNTMRQSGATPSATPSLNGSSSADVAIENLARCVMHSQMPDLPIFDGRDKKLWADFESEYRLSTQQGKFDEQANLRRLRKSLKSPARDNVAEELLGTSATSVMDTLRYFYGRPEVILPELVKDLRESSEVKNGFDPKLKQLSLKLSRYIRVLKDMKLDSQLTDLTLEHILLEKLKQNYSLYSKWNEMKLSNPTLNLVDLDSFLKNKWIHMPADMIDPEEKSPSKQHRHHRHRYALSHTVAKSSPGRDSSVSSCTSSCSGSSAGLSSSSSSSSSKESKCAACDEDHKIWKCVRFKSKSVADREKLVREKKLCYGCLSDKHVLRNCRIKRKCDIDGCDQFHSRFLHVRRSRSPVTHKSENATPAVATPAVIAPAVNLGHTKQNKKGDILMKIGIMRCYGPKGRRDELVLLDDANQQTMMEKSLMKDLGYEGRPETFTLQWTGHQKRTEDAIVFNMSASDLIDSESFCINNVYAVDDLGLPTQDQDAEKLKEKYKHLRGIDFPSFNEQPRILLGLDHTHLLVGSETRKGRIDEPFATKTKLGWVVYGKTKVGGSTSNFNGSHFPINPKCDRELDDHQQIVEISRDEITSTEINECELKPEIFESAEVLTSETPMKMEIAKSENVKIGNYRWEVDQLVKEVECDFVDSSDMKKSTLKFNELKKSKTFWKPSEVIVKICLIMLCLVSIGKVHDDLVTTSNEKLSSEIQIRSFNITRDENYCKVDEIYAEDRSDDSRFLCYQLPLTGGGQNSSSEVTEEVFHRKLKHEVFDLPRMNFCDDHLSREENLDFIYRPRDEFIGNDDYDLRFNCTVTCSIEG